MKKLYLLLSGCFLYGSTLIVNQDGTGDYITIQEALNNAQDGDTVLVHPGTYYENLNLMGRNNLTLASLEIINGDASFIDSTVIDGNNSGSCIRIMEEEQNVMIRGFSITNGYGDNIGFNGPSVGGGIRISLYSNVSVKNCNIYNNFAVIGGGISATLSDLYLSGVTIKNNIGKGLIMSSSENLIFDEENRCSIYYNHPQDIRVVDGGMTYVYLDTFTVLEPDSYYALAMDSLAPHGNYDTLIVDIHHGWMELVNQDLYVASDGNDNHSGLTPDEPLKNIAFAMYKIQSDSLNPKTIHVASGEYHWDDGQIFPIAKKSFVNLIGEDMESTFLFNNSIGSLFVSHGTKNAVIENFTLRNLSDIIYYWITETYTENMIHRNIIIEDFISVREKLTAFSDNTNMLMENVIFRNCTASLNAGFFSYEGSGTFTNCTFDNLYATGDQYFTVCYNSLYLVADEKVTVDNCIFSNSVNTIPGDFNDSKMFTISDDEYGSGDKIVTGCLFYNNHSEGDYIASLGGAYTRYIINCTFAGNEAMKSTFASSDYVFNSIFYDLTDYELYLKASPYWETVLTVGNSLIKNGIDGICNEDPWGECNTASSYSTIIWLEGNLDTIPYFNDSINGEDYSLQWNSPCIDGGTLELPDGIVLPEYDLAGNPRISGSNIDIGAFEFQQDEVLTYNTGWNLISTPRLGVEFNCPEAIENSLYSYNQTDGYTNSENVELGIGYWLRFGENGECSVSGMPVYEHTITIFEDWNIIGSISSPVDVNTIIDENSLIIPGTVYGFDGNYFEAETIEPGYGYWLRSSGEGEISLSSSASLTKSRHFHPPKNLNTLTLEHMDLFFGNSIKVENPLSFTLPPKPPAPSKDIRFSGDTKLCSTHECLIEVMNDGSPLTFECEIKEGEVWEIVDESGEVFECSSVNVIELSGESKTLVFRKSTSPQTPTEFALFPAHPNPFNPVTTISFSIPNVETLHATSLRIYDITGKLVETLVDGDLSPGNHNVQWNGSDQSGHPLSSGVYISRLETKTFSSSQKMLLLK